MIEFLRIETRGGNLVAVFDQGYQITSYDYRFHGQRARAITPDDGTFCLNESNLRARIANLERDGRDTSVERTALANLVNKSNPAHYSNRFAEIERLRRQT